MSEVKTDKLSPRTSSGTLTLGTSGDTFSIPSGVTLSGLTTSSLPVDSVLQVVTNMPNVGNVSLATASWTEVSSSFRQAITPTYSNSKLIIEVLFMFGGNNTTNITHFKIYDITNNADVELSTSGSRTSLHGSARQVDGDVNDVDMMYIQTITTSANTTARTYGFYAKNETGTTAKYYFAGSSDAVAIGYAKPIFKITEVAQ